MSQFIEMFGNPFEINSEVVPLSSLCSINPSKPKGLDDSLSVSFIPMDRISEDGEYAEFETKPLKDVKKGFTYCAEDDVLFAKITPCMENGKGAILKGLSNGIGFGSTEFHVLRPILGISNSEWLYFLTKLNGFRIDAAKNMTGTGGQKRVPSSYLLNFKVLKPQLEVQREFAKIVHQADKSKFGDFKSQFIEMFGDPMTNTKAWVEFGYIGNYTQIVLGTTPNSKNSSYWNGEIKWITPAEMTEESYYIYDTERHLTEEGLKAANLTLLPCRSVLFSTRAPIGKVGLVGSPMYCNQGFKNFVCGDQLNPVYLYYSLIFKREYLVSLGTGTTFKELSKKAVENLKIAVPPLILQNKFEEIYQQADKSKFGDFKSQFIEMFGNPVTNTKGWKTAKIKDVAPEMPSKEQLSGKIWLLNLDMIESNTGRIIEKVYEDVENALSVQSFDEGNVLFSKLRPYLNKVVIPDEPGMATTELVPLRPEPSKLHKVFLSHMLRGNQFVNYANDIAGGTKMPRMPLTELRNFDCILPPMDKQLEFVFIAEQADKSKSVIQKALVYLNDIQSDELGKIA